MLPFELTKDTPYLALSGELWGVFYEYFKLTEIDRVINWSCYKGFLPYSYEDCISPPSRHPSGFTHKPVATPPPPAWY